MYESHEGCQEMHIIFFFMVVNIFAVQKSKL